MARRPESGQDLVPLEVVERRILLIRGHKVMLDRDLAELYQVKPIALRQAVKRNGIRFPDDFVFHLSKEEAERLLSQTVIPSRRSLGGYLPYAFTEQGVAMLSSVLRSERAALVNIAIMRTFVRLRQMLATHKDLAQKLQVTAAHGTSSGRSEAPNRIREIGAIWNSALSKASSKATPWRAVRPF